MQKKRFFGKRESSIMYAIAVILMVFLHTMKFPERIPTEYMWDYIIFDGYNLEQCFAIFSSICVGIYAFISGYGLCVIAQKIEKYSFKIAYKEQWKRLKNFYKIYWLVFIFFIPYGIYNGIFHIDLNHFIQCFIGKASRMNNTWWYVWMYVKILMLFPIFYKIVYWVDKFIENPKIGGVCWSILLIILVFLFHSDVCLSTCFLGIVFAKYKIFDTVYGIINREQGYKVGWIIGLIMLVVLFFTFVYIFNHIDHTYLRFDIIAVPIFIFGICLFVKEINCWGISKWFEKLGSYSVYIWLVHAFFCWYYWQSWVTWIRYSFFIAIWVLLLSWIVGYVLNKICIKLKFK